VWIPWQEATGPCKARHLAQQLWDGEEFYLQIDSHMRFVPGWDSQLRHMLQQAEQVATYGKAVISSYPPAYEVRHLSFFGTLDQVEICSMCNTGRGVRIACAAMFACSSAVFQACNTTVECAATCLFVFWHCNRLGTGPPKHFIHSSIHSFVH